jgi:hypothetical protein
MVLGHGRSPLLPIVARNPNRLRERGLESRFLSKPTGAMAVTAFGCIKPGTVAGAWTGAFVYVEQGDTKVLAVFEHNQDYIHYPKSVAEGIDHYDSLVAKGYNEDFWRRSQGRRRNVCINLGKKVPRSVTGCMHFTNDCFHYAWLRDERPVGAVRRAARPLTPTPAVEERGCLEAR